MSQVPNVRVISNLMYGKKCTSLDISHPMRVLRRYVSKSRKKIWTTIKRAFRYLCGTIDYGIYYEGIPRLDRKIDV